MTTRVTLRWPASSAMSSSSAAACRSPLPEGRRLGGERRAHDADHPPLVHAQALEDAGVGAEVVQRVLLLEARVAPHLLGAGAEGQEVAEGHGLGHRHLVHEPQVEAAQRLGALVVEQGELRDAQGPGGQGQVAGGVADDHVEVALAARGQEPGGAIGEAYDARRGALAAMVAAAHGTQAVALDQLLRVAEAPRRERHRVPLAFQAADDGREEEQVGGGAGDVDPDLHRGCAGRSPQARPAATPAATSWTACSVRLGCMGSARFWAAAASVTGKSPSLWPRAAKAGCSCSGVV